MHKLIYALATLTFVSCATSAQADDSGHIGINSLRWQMRRMHRPEGHAGPIAKPIRRQYPDGTVDWSWGYDR